MKNRIVIFICILLLLPVVLFAGTFFEDEKKTSDPYVGERGGVNSIFVNPAGAAGQNGFEASISYEFQSKRRAIVLLSGLLEMTINKLKDDSISMTSIMEVSHGLSELFDSGIIDKQLINSIMEGTALEWNGKLDWHDLLTVRDVARSIDQGERTMIEDKFEKILNGTNTDFYDALENPLGEMSMQFLGSAKTGLLIKGWGFGVYDQARADVVLKPSSRKFGVNTVYNELGLLTSYGGKLRNRKLALGISGNYGILLKNASLVRFIDLQSLLHDRNTLKYGYSWGIDVGAIWRPTPTLGIGLLLSDLFGSTRMDTPRSADGLSGFAANKSYFMKDIKYKVTIDVDMGIFWQPDCGRFIRSSLGFDVYNIVGYTRSVIENKDTPEEALSRSLSHIRIGANFTFFKVLKVATQYFDHYISVGAGVDLIFMEIYGEFKMHDEIFYIKNVNNTRIGGDLMLRIHF